MKAKRQLSLAEVLEARPKGDPTIDVSQASC